MKEKKKEKKRKERNKITWYEAPWGYLKNGFGCETGNFDYSL